MPILVRGITEKNKLRFFEIVSFFVFLLYFGVSRINRKAGIKSAFIFFCLKSIKSVTFGLIYNSVLSVSITAIVDKWNLDLSHRFQAIWKCLSKDSRFFFCIDGCECVCVCVHYCIFCCVYTCICLYMRVRVRGGGNWRRERNFAYVFCLFFICLFLLLLLFLLLF